MSIQSFQTLALVHQLQTLVIWFNGFMVLGQKHMNAKAKGKELMFLTH